MSRRPIERAEISAMVGVIAHRGPDDEAYHFEPGVGLGFRRLSIVDLDGGRQPLDNEDGTAWLVFNGEIYNHRALRQRLETAGHTFRTQSDSEVIVHAYEEWGPRCAAELRGIFAFAIWDRTRRRLILGRDHSGIKPLYFARVADDWLFASEAKSILASGRLERRLDLVGLFRHQGRSEGIERGERVERVERGERVERVESGESSSTESSPFRGIRQVGPGHVLVIDDGGERAERYWQYRPSQSLASTDLEAAIVETRRVLSESVRMQLMADVPIGAYLSGGLDSSAVVACAVKEHGHAGLRTYTSASRDFEDEGFSRQLVSELDIRGTFVDLRLPADPEPLLRRVAWMAEGAFDLGFAYRFALARAVRDDGIKVLLTGQGIDEILTGYSPSTATYLQTHQHAAAWRGVDPWLPPPMFGPRVLDELSTGGQAADVAGAQARIMAEALSRQHATLANHLLRFEDRMGMANSVEVRVPLLDHELLEMLTAIPHPGRMELFSGKRILREAARPWLPASIADRPKTSGFNTSMTPLSRRALAGRAGGLDRLLSRADVERRGYFDWSYCASRIATHDYGALDAIFIVHLLDDLFVASFSPEEHEATLPLAHHERPDPSLSSVPTAIADLDDVPTLHVDIIGFETSVDATSHALSSEPRLRAIYAQRGMRGTGVASISIDLLQILALVDGARSIRQIHAALQELAQLEMSDLVEALGDLERGGVVGWDTR